MNTRWPGRNCAWSTGKSRRPGSISWQQASFCPLADGGFLLLSSKSGWNHLYRVGAGGAEKALSSGEWSVSQIEFVDEKKGQVFFSADKEDSTRSDLYRVASERRRPAAADAAATAPTA